MTKRWMLLTVLGAAARLPAGDGPFRPAETFLEEPTFRSLGVRWYGEGDPGWKTRITLDVRQAGTEPWHAAMPLFRVEPSKCEPPLDAGRELFAGSVFDLTPGTEYELRLRLESPGGPGGEKILRASTRKELRVDPKARVLHSAPGDGGGIGIEEEPFRGLKAAQEAAAPGDVIDLAPGVYAGSFQVTRQGAEGKPIVWRGSTAGETVIDGGGASCAVTASDARHVWFLGLTIRNGGWGISANGASDLWVDHCRFTAIQSGFSAHRPGQKRLTVTNSTFEGPCTWPRTKGIEDPEGVEIQGDGCVVAYNRIHGFADGISIFRGPSHGNDIYGNEIGECTDDAIEMDYGGQNNRCFRNLGVNIFQGISFQPILGGPAYALRNVLYNIEVEPFKIHNSPSGIFCAHNTTVKKGMPLLVWTHEPFSNSIFRNNLFVGTADGYALEITPLSTRTDWDWDGFAGGSFAPFAKWNGERFGTFEDFRARSGIERHAILLEESPFAGRLLPPEDPGKRFPCDRIDVRLAASSRAIDAGVPLPGLNDGFALSGPDLGACEAGTPPVQYGPRPEWSD